MLNLIDQIIENCHLKEVTDHYVKVCKTCSTIIHYIETYEDEF